MTATQHRYIIGALAVVTIAGTIVSALVSGGVLAPTLAGSIGAGLTLAANILRSLSDPQSTPAVLGQPTGIEPPVITTTTNPTNPPTPPAAP